MPGQFTAEQLRSMQGKSVFDSTGEKIGGIEEIYLDDATREPEWIGLGSGLFGMKRILVPLEGAQAQADGIRVPFDKDKVKNAPDVKVDEHSISEEAEAQLYSYYGMGFSERPSPSQLPDRGAPASAERGERQEGRGRLVELREEELRARTEQVQTGEARVAKDVVEEERTIEVPRTREDVTIERRPVEGRPRASGGVGSGEEVRVPLHEDQVTVEKEPVVREEVEIKKEQVEDTERVQETVRREEPRIERQDR
jgi:uncharacterized protein (TIGR02271 family)